LNLKLETMTYYYSKLKIIVVLSDIETTIKLLQSPSTSN